MRRAEAPGAGAVGGGEDGRDLPSDEDMAVLFRRIQEVRDRPQLPVLMIDAMLPGQRLRFKSEDPMLKRLVELEEVGVLGIWQGQLLRRGVKASISEVGPGEWELRGQRHVEVASPASESDGLTMAQFEFVEDDAQEIDVEIAKTLVPLVERWRGLVEGTSFERFEGQVRGILADLGPMPPVEEPGRLALWVAALVNPLPALGVAYEIRPAALAAATVSERLQVALQGIQTSIGHLSGEKPLF